MKCYNESDKELTGTSRNMCFTSFKTKNFLKLDPKIRYAVWQVEICPKTKNHHVQGYVEFNGPERPSFLKKHFGDKDLGCFVRTGTASQARDYCMKEETRAPGPNSGPFEIGVFKIVKRGERTDLKKEAEKVGELILEGASDREIFSESPSFFLNNPRAVVNARLAIAQEKSDQRVDIKCHIVFGVKGDDKGKRLSDIFGGKKFFRVSGKMNTLWLDGYSSEEIIYIENFRGESEMSYGAFLEWLKLVTTKSVKNSYTFPLYDKIIITSEMHPIDWYPNDLCFDFVEKVGSCQYYTRINGNPYFQVDPLMKKLYNYFNLNPVSSIKDFLSTEEMVNDFYGSREKQIVSLYNNVCYSEIYEEELNYELKMLKANSGREEELTNDFEIARENAMKIKEEYENAMNKLKNL